MDPPSQKTAEGRAGKLWTYIRNGAQGIHRVTIRTDQSFRSDRKTYAFLGKYAAFLQGRMKNNAFSRGKNVAGKIFGETEGRYDGCGEGVFL